MSITTRTYAASTVAATNLDVSNSAWYESVTIVNRSTSASPVELWVRMDGTAATVAGAGCYLIPANMVRTFTNLLPATEPAIGVVGTTPVQLISSSICPFAVEFN